MAEFTYAGQNYSLPKELVNFYRKWLVLEIFKQNYSIKNEYSKFTFKYGEFIYTTTKFYRLDYDMLFGMLWDMDKDRIEKFYNKNVKFEEDKKRITFIGVPYYLDFPIDDEVKKAFKEQVIDYFKKRFFPETEEDFEFLAKNVSSEIFHKLHEMLSKFRELQYSKEEEDIIQNEVVFCIKKLNILEQFGVDEFKFAQLELDLQIKFLALMLFYKKTEPINSIIKFFNSDFLTEAEINNFMEMILDKFLEERINEGSVIKNFALKINVIGQIGINQTTNEIMFKIIADKLFNLNDEDKNQFIGKLKEFINDDDENLQVLTESLGNSVKLNTPEFEIFFKYSYFEMIIKIIYIHDFDPNFIEKNMTLLEFNKKIDEDENLKSKILEFQDAEILIKILLKDTESVENLKQKKQIIFSNAQEIFDDIHNDKVESGRREIYRKLLVKAMDFAEEKIYTEYFINVFRKCTIKRWWQHEKTVTEKFKIINDKRINLDKVYGKDKIALKALANAKGIVLLEVENKRLNEKIDEFAMNNLQTSEEVFDLGEKLEKDINSSSQPENVKEGLLKKVNDIGQEKLENVPPQQINSDFKFFTNR